MRGGGGGGSAQTAATLLSPGSDQHSWRLQITCVQLLGKSLHHMLQRLSRTQSNDRHIAAGLGADEYRAACRGGASQTLASLRKFIVADLQQTCRIFELLSAPQGVRRTRGRQLSVGQSPRFSNC